MAFKDDWERQESAYLPNANIPVHISNLKTMSENFKVATATTQKYGFVIMFRAEGIHWEHWVGPYWTTSFKVLAMQLPFFCS